MQFVLHLAFLAAAAATSLRDILRERSDLTTFESLLNQYQAWQFLEEGSTNITVMAPNDAAYDKLLKIGLDLRAMPSDFTVPLLRYHLLREQIGRARIPDESGPVLVQTGLTPPNMTQPSPVKLFWQAGELHVESGLQMTARIVDADVGFAGGVVHVLDASLVAPHNISATLWMNGRSKTFLQLMEETGLVSELESLHDTTLFVPSDEAWQRSSSMLDTMDLSEKRALLRTHAIKGRVVYREELSHGQMLETVGGQTLHVRVNENRILVDDHAVLQADILWYNGVAHMTDGVVMLEETNSTLQMAPTIDQHQHFLAAGCAT